MSNTRGAAGLSLMAMLSGVYLAFFPFLRFLGGLWQGVLGVVLGLFICSLPARHFLDMLIYWRIEGRRFRSRGSLGGWIAFNAFILFCGWLVIVVGVTLFMPAR